MHARKVLVLASLSALIAACAVPSSRAIAPTRSARSTPAAAPSSASTTSAPTAEREADLPGRVPAPFTIEALREALVPGRTFELVVESADAPPARERVRVFLADAQKVSLATQRLDDDELPVGPPASRTLTWHELRATWSFPADSATIAAVTIDTPFGSFAGHRYAITTLQEGHRLVRTFEFVDTVPGMPVEELVRRDDAFVRSTTRLSVSPLPSPPPAPAP